MFFLPNSRHFVILSLGVTGVTGVPTNFKEKYEKSGSS